MMCLGIIPQCPDRHHFHIRLNTHTNLSPYHIIIIIESTDSSNRESRWMKRPISQHFYRRRMRRQSGYRMFSKEDIHRLQMIQFYKEFHFPLDKIAIILEGSEKNRMEMMSIQLLEIQEQMRKYERIEKMLQAALCCQRSLPVQDKKETGTVVIGIDLQNDIKEGGALPCKRFYTLFQPLQNFYHRIRELQIPIIYLCDSHQRGKDKELEIWCDHMIEGTYGEKIIDELTPKNKIMC